MSTSGDNRMHTRQYLIALAGIGYHVKLIGVLTVKPELRAVAEVGGKAHSRVRRNASLSGNDTLNAALRHGGVHGKTVLAYAQGLQELLIQYFPWMHRRHAVVHLHLLMVIGDFHRAGVSFFPDETESPLVIDTDAVLACPVSFQGFKAVSRRNAQVLQAGGVVQHFELAHGGALDVRGQIGGLDAVKESFCPTVFEARYHGIKVTSKTYYRKRIFMECA